MQKPPKRPRDGNQLAKFIIDTATGDTKQNVTDDKRNPAAVALGKKGGEARAKSLTSSERSEIAKKAAKSRWNRDGKDS